MAAARLILRFWYALTGRKARTKTDADLLVDFHSATDELKRASEETDPKQRFRKNVAALDRLGIAARELQRRGISTLAEKTRAS